MRMGALRKVLREASRVDADREQVVSVIRPAFTELADAINANPSLTASPDGIGALEGIFKRLRPGETPNEKDVEDEVKKFVKTAWSVYDSQDDRLDLAATWAASVRPAGNIFKMLHHRSSQSSGISKKEAASAPVEGKTWGRYLFGEDRLDVPFETNVPAEARALTAITDWVSEQQQLPAKVVKDIQRLVSNGEYMGLLTPDPQHVEFYRGLYSVPTRVLAKLLNGPPQAVGGAADVNIDLPQRDGPGASWTANKDVAHDYSCLTKADGRTTWSVVLTARRDDNPVTTFIINFQKLYHLMRDAQFQSDQSDDAEVYGAGSVRICRIEYYGATPP